MFGLFNKNKLKTKKERIRMKNLNLEIQKKEERRAILEIELERVEQEIGTLRDQVLGLMRKVAWRTSAK